jgi:hypothetical protein
VPVLDGVPDGVAWSLSDAVGVSEPVRV